MWCSSLWVKTIYKPPAGSFPGQHGLGHIHKMSADKIRERYLGIEGVSTCSELQTESVNQDERCGDTVASHTGDIGASDFGSVGAIFGGN
jgi:hypothetical protein